MSSLKAKLPARRKIIVRILGDIVQTKLYKTQKGSFDTRMSPLYETH